MSQQVLAQTAQAAPQAQTAGRLLQRQCDCGTHTQGQGRCGACEDKAKTVRRAGGGEPSQVPDIVQDVLRGPGRPLDADVLSFMEPRFGAEFTQVAPAATKPLRMPLEIGAANDPLEDEADRAAGRVIAAKPGRHRHDFSGVRIHDDAHAARSARAINAEAYTVGRDIVFGEGRYAPHRPDGRRLLAHELAHVMQQTGASSLRRAPVRIQRQVPPGPQPAQPPQQQGQQPLPQGLQQQQQPAGAAAGSGGHVDRIAISCHDKRMALYADVGTHTYRMDSCQIPIGSYDPGVVHQDASHASLDFRGQLPANSQAHVSFRVDPGQPNPATMLAGQNTVHVDVVQSVPPAPQNPVAPRPAPSPTDVRSPSPQCAIRLADRELVPSGNYNKNLFAPKNFNKKIWSHTIPLGEFGWVDVGATASGSLSGNFSASYGPGRLSDICLSRVISTTASSAPIKHPLLGSDSNTSVQTYKLAGRARFDLPAQAAIHVNASGDLVIDGSYLSVIQVAAARGGITAAGTASASAGIGASVEIVATATAAQAHLSTSDNELGVTIKDNNITGIDLAAEVGAHARAGVTFSVNATAGFKLAGFNLWSESWNLANFASHIAWHGGVKYSPNPGMHFNLGALGVDGSPDDEDLSDHEDAAVVHEDEIANSLFDEHSATVATPDGLSPSNAIPFDWYKPIELYPESLHFPNADPVTDLKRTDTPTLIYYNHNGRRMHAELGVSDWPAVGKKFSFMPYDTRHTPQQDQFNTVLDQLGYSRAGLDAEHVWDVYLLGSQMDRFSNLWPASNQEQQLAGTRHRNQIRAAEAALGGSANGRWFVIARTRHPA